MGKHSLLKRGLCNSEGTLTIQPGEEATSGKDGFGKLTFPNRQSYERLKGGTEARPWSSEVRSEELLQRGHWTEEPKSVPVLLSRLKISIS